MTRSDGDKVGLRQQFLQCCMIPIFADKAQSEEILQWQLFINVLDRDLILQLSPNLGIQRVLALRRHICTPLSFPRTFRGGTQGLHTCDNSTSLKLQLLVHQPQSRNTSDAISVTIYACARVRFRLTNNLRRAHAASSKQPLA